MQIIKALSYGVLVLIPLGTFFGFSTKVFAAEQRCNELFANCVCSEPLNTPNYSLVPGTSWGWNPADSTTKECRSSGWSGVAYENNSLNLTVDTAATNPTMFAALPAGASVTYIPRSYAGAGLGAMGTEFTKGVDPVQRRVFRFYRYYSPDFQFTDSTAPLCNSAKVFQGGFNGAYTGGPMLSVWSIYDIATSLQWSGNFDSFLPLAGTVGSLPSPNSMRGKWFRFEVAINGTGTTPGTTSIEWYMKNITDNTPEITILNTASEPRMNGIYPTSELTDFVANGFRSDNGNACPGYMAQAYVLAAAFSTNASQRIGAACEVEGGCSASTPTPDTSAPSTPTNLTATALSTTQINLSWTASTDNVGVSGYRIYRNGTQIATTAGATYSNTALTPSTSYAYTVAAYDASGNASVQSSSVSATTQAAPAAVTTPVGSWTFDTADLTTTTAIDRSGLSNTLTLVNNPTRVTGKVNQALSFDGVSSTASCTDASCGGTTKLDMGTSDWSVSAWVKTTAVSGGVIASKTGFMCGGNPDGWMTYISGTGRFLASLNDSVADCAFSSDDGSVVTDGTWHLVTAVFNRAGNLVRYVDGMQTGTPTNIAALNGVSIDAAAPFQVGARSAAGDSMSFNGSLDEVKVYPRALSLTEIQALYAAGTSVLPTPDTTAPTTPTNLTATAISTTQINLSWTASTDNVGVTGYKIYRNGVLLTTTTATSYANTALSASTAYTYTVAAYDTAGNTSVQSATASATTQAISIPDTTVPSISLTAPAANATVSSAVTVSASASDNVGVSGVQFKLDGANLGTEDITVPYSITWDTTATANGSHTLTATARDAVGNQTTSTGISVTVSNSVSSATCEAATGSKCYYVSNKAGSGAGTFANPYGMADLPRSDTPACALSSPAIEPMMPGDVLYFRGGNYSFSTCGTADYWSTGYIRPARSGLVGKPITFKAYPSETVQVQVSSGTQPVFGTVGLNYIRFQGFTVLGGFGMITGRNNEISYNEIIGSFVNNVFNHDGIAVGIFGDVTDAPWIHHNIIRGVTGLSENSAGLKFYSTTNAIIEDNYIHDNTAGIHNKNANQNNTFRRNWVSNNEKAQIMGGTDPTYRWKAFIYDNVIDGNGASSLYVSNGSEIHDNLIRGGILAGTWQGDSANSNIWNNIVLSKTSSATGYYDSAANFVSSGATAQLNYMNYNLYNVSPGYSFGQYTTTPQNFTLLDMKSRGFEQNSSVATSPQIFVDEISYVLQNAWKTSGRYSDAYGPDTIAQIINPTRYGPGALSSGSPSVPAPTPIPVSTKFILTDRVQATATLNVRAAASATGALLGSQSATALGTVVGGPINADGFNWWNVNYDTGADGWSVEDYLVKYVAPTADTTAPSVPSGLTATALSTTQINLSWSASTDNVGVTGYRIYRNGTQIATTAGTTYSDTMLTPSTAYTYAVAAYDAVGNSSTLSISASATTQAVVPTTTPAPGPNDTIIFQDDFEGGNLSRWDEVSPTRYSITSVPANVKSGTGALEALIDSTSSGNLGKWYMPGYDEVYVAFDVKFETGFQNMRSDGYGMHFFEQLGNRVDNQWSASGQAGVKPNGTDFFESVLDPNQIYTDPTLRPFGFYTYYPDMTCPTAPALCYGNTINQTPPAAPLTSGVWHKVVFRIKANTVGQKDGAQSLWFNGVQKIDMQNIRWRDTTNLKLNQLRFDFYMPGAVTTEHVWIDNLVAWTPSTTSTPAPVPASTKFILTDRIQTTTTLNVRTTPSTTGALLGSQSSGTLGTIIGGPTNSGGFNWWNVNYDTGVDGWSVEDYLVKYVAPTADTTPPIISLTTPLSGSTVSGTTVTLSATASDNTGVSGVQFKLNGSNLGVEDTTAPYSITWNTTSSTNGTHTLTATARDAAGNQTTSTSVTVTTSNITVTPDTIAPSAPNNLTITPTSSSQINLAWIPSTDNVGVAGYRIYRNGILLTTTATNSYSNTGLTPSTAYTYTIAAYDAAGNVSTQSASASATTQAAVTATTSTPPSVPSNTSTTNTSPAGGPSGGVGSTVPVTTTQPATPPTPTTSASAPSLSLTRTLYQGAKGSDVKSLQTFLISSGYLAPSNTTGFYGPLTTKAVQKYQCAQNIVCSGTQTSTGYGMVGLKTRAKLNGSSSSYVSTSTLTPAQADSIIALLQSFGADAAVIARVKVVLGR